MIRVVAVRSKKFGSKFIAWGLGEKASHLAIQISDTVFHSELKGVHSDDVKTFTDAHEIVDEKILNQTYAAEVMLLGSMRTIAAQEYKYDVGAFVYFTWRAALKKFFGRPFPFVSVGDADDQFLCVELLYAFIDNYVRITGKSPAIGLPRELGIMSPQAALNYVKGAYP